MRERAQRIVGMHVSRVRRPLQDRPQLMVLSHGPSSGAEAPPVRLLLTTIAWRIDAQDRILAGSSDPVEDVRRALRALLGKTVFAVQVAAPSMDTTFDFAGLQLRVFPTVYEDPAYDPWTVIE
jgi:hypothetical protein